MSDTKKKLPASLIALFCILIGFCIVIVIFMRQGFETFNTFQPDTSNMTPSVPGFP